jgi:hypothetical protein
MKAVITFDSAAHALAGDEALAKAGLPVSVMGRPVELGGDCGFCLRVGPGDLDRALKILRGAGLAWAGAYLDSPGASPRFSKAFEGPPEEPL